MSKQKHPTLKSMSLRDYVAANVIAAWARNIDGHPPPFGEKAAAVARWAYEMADAMMEARQ